MNKTKKLSGFAKGMLIYILVFTVIAAVALGIFYGYIGAYEESRPVSCVKEYVENIKANGATEACIAAIPEIDTNIKSHEDTVALLDSLMAEATYSKRSSLSTPEAEAYAIKADGNVLGIIYIQQQGESSFGFTNWQVVREEYDLSPLQHSIALNVPGDYGVSVNGTKLDSSYITDDKIEYEVFTYAYKDFKGLPYLVRYESGLWLGDAEVIVCDESGREIPVEEQTELCYLDNCTEEFKAELAEFCEEFARRYSTFGANIDGLTLNHYAYLKLMVVPHGQLHTRMSQAFGTLGYATTKSCELLSCTLNACSDIGNGLILADISYSNEIRGNADPVISDSNTRLIIRMDEDGDMLVDGMYNY